MLKKIILVLMLVLGGNLAKGSGDATSFRDPFVADKNGEFSSPEITTQLFSLRYLDAAKFATLLGAKNSGLLSDKGYANADVRTNSVWVKDLPQNIADVKRYLQQLDVPVKQILIQAYIVNVDENFIRELGLRFGTVQAQKQMVDNHGLKMDLPSSFISPGHFNIAIAKWGEGNVLELELTALENEGHGKIISSPRLLTTNREAAYIESGNEIPYQEKSSYGNTSVTFKKAVLSLKVTPFVTPNNKIVLHLVINQDKISSIVVNGVPAIRTQEISTQVQVANEQTVVLGGIFEHSEESNQERIPFLGSLPAIGALFRQHMKKTERRELLVFVTPKIISN